MWKILVVGEHVGGDCREAEYHDFDVRELHEKPSAKAPSCAVVADFFEGFEGLNYKADCQICDVGCANERKYLNEIFKCAADKINNKNGY